MLMEVDDMDSTAMPMQLENASTANKMQETVEEEQAGPSCGARGKGHVSMVHNEVINCIYTLHKSNCHRVRNIF
jgi:hypothetical protein